MINVFLWFLRDHPATVQGQHCLVHGVEGEYQSGLPFSHVPLRAAVPSWRRSVSKVAIPVVDWTLALSARPPFFGAWQFAQNWRGKSEWQLVGLKRPTGAIRSGLIGYELCE